MIKSLNILAIFLFSLLATQALAQTMESYGHKYENQAGSIMEFNLDEKDGAINGYYNSALGCAKGVAYPLTGWRNGKAISFTVNFGTCGSITSWVGHYQDDGSIKTIWTLSRGENADWDTLLTGSSIFKPIN